MGNTYWYSREHFIIKNDLLERLKIDLKYSTSTIMWDGIEIPMKSRDATLEDSYFIHDSPCFVEAAERIKRILDVKYEPADLEEVVANCTHLSEEEKEGLHSLLKKIYKSLFDGSLEPDKVRITISNYAVILHCIMLVLFQFHGSMSKPYDTKSIGYTK